MFINVVNCYNVLDELLVTADSSSIVHIHNSALHS